MFFNKKCLILALVIGAVNYSNAFALSSSFDVPQFMYLLARGGGGGHAGGGGRAEGAGRTPAERAADRAARNAVEAADAAALDNPGYVQPVTGTTYIENTPTNPVTQPTPVIPAVPNPDRVNTPLPANGSAANPINPDVQPAQNVQVVVDQLITQNLQLKLSADRRINANKVEIITNQNVVTLTGDVSSQAQKQAIENYAKSIDGVQAVISNITVNGQ